jgi:hypothetical protein
VLYPDVTPEDAAEVVMPHPDRVAHADPRDARAIDADAAVEPA